MRKLSTVEKSKMVGTAAESFNDNCKIGAWSMGRNTYGEEIPVWTYGVEIECGFELLGDSDKRDQIIVTNTQGYFRLPLNTTLSKLDKIKLTKRYGKTVAIEFEVISEPVVGLSCLRVECKAIGV